MATPGQDRLERRLATILAADVAGYSRLTGLDEEGTHIQGLTHGVNMRTAFWRAAQRLPEHAAYSNMASVTLGSGGSLMKRRDFISLLSGAAIVWPIAARGQQSKVARIGVLYIGLADAESFKKEFREGLRELGHIEGQNIALEFRSGEGKLDRLPELAAELVRLEVDVIVPLYLARPGENITGVSLMSAVFVGKCVELFRDMLPATRRVAVLTNAADALFAKLVLEHVEVAARLSGIKIQPITLRGPDQELDAAFAAMTKEQADAVVIQGSLSTKRLADLAREHRLPAASSTRAFVDAGGLMSYGADGPALFRLGAMFVHRLLRGAQPRDLPIEQPTKFELAINLKTAKAMGLAIPETFLVRADTLLE